jgi:NAD(P)-dependent dehydrogenase (short-subunit alcohol dehydrogenase family)
MDLRWRTVVVTGAGSGLGREVALRFARVGAGVVVVDRDVAAAEEASGIVRASRVQAWSVQADVTSDDDLRHLARRLQDLGGADVLVHVAVGWTPGEHDLRTPVRLTQLFLDGLADRRGRVGEPGAVVHVAPSAATGAESDGSSEHAAATAGLARFTTSMAGPDIAARARVTCVVPGSAPPARVAGTVLDLATRGAAGAIVELGREHDAPDDA